jgi:hypothetical protein
MTMVDVSTKGSTVRIAKASAKVLMQPETLQKIKDNDFKKSSPLKLLGQMYRNFVGCIYGRSSITITYFGPL